MKISSPKAINWTLKQYGYNSIDVQFRILALISNAQWVNREQKVQKYKKFWLVDCSTVRNAYGQKEFVKKTKKNFSNPFAFCWVKHESIKILQDNFKCIFLTFFGGTVFTNAMFY
jgi:hypothetical protein